MSFFLFGVTMKTCKTCGKKKQEKEFATAIGTRGQKLNADCQECRKKMYGKRTRLKRYGITIEEYNAILIKQNGKCAICGNGSTEKDLSVDHDHITGHIRGLLCNSCNMAIGLFDENITLLRKAIDYLT